MPEHDPGTACPSSESDSTAERGDADPWLALLSEQRFRPPGAASTRTFSIPTLELRTLLLDIPREHPNASVPLILGLSGPSVVSMHEPQRHAYFWRRWCSCRGGPKTRVLIPSSYAAPSSRFG
jgi:hypothetical protein